MAELKIGCTAMINHGSAKQAKLNGTLCVLIEYNALDEDCKEPAWCVRFLGEEKVSDQGEICSWGWIQARYLIAQDHLLDEHKNEREYAIQDT